MLNTYMLLSLALYFHANAMLLVVYFAQVNRALHYASGLKAVVTGVGAADSSVDIGDATSNQILVHYTGSSTQDVCVHIAQE